ncbi:MAG: hypothetical protein AABZ74_17150 [Cyanobacteriota bacterium]
MPSVKEKETMGSYKRFLLNKGKNEKVIEIVRNGNKKGYSNDVISDLSGLSIKEIEEILKNAPRQEKEE